MDTVEAAVQYRMVYKCPECEKNDTPKIEVRQFPTGTAAFHAVDFEEEADEEYRHEVLDY